MSVFLFEKTESLLNPRSEGSYLASLERLTFRVFRIPLSPQKRIETSNGVSLFLFEKAGSLLNPRSVGSYRATRERLTLCVFRIPLSPQKKNRDIQRGVSISFWEGREPSQSPVGGFLSRFARTINALRFSNPLSPQKKKNRGIKKEGTEKGSLFERSY